MDADLKKLEDELRKLSPSGLHDDLLSRLDEAMCRWHEAVPEEEKVVHLSLPVAAPRRRIFSWPAAAAVAALGGSVALWPGFAGQAEGQPSTLANFSNVSLTPLVSDRSVNANFIPVKASSNVVNTSDRGIVTLSDGRPARCLAIQFQDQIQLRNAEGEVVKVEQPAFKIIFVPLKAD